jgi:hypothetical protein
MSRPRGETSPNLVTLKESEGRINYVAAREKRGLRINWFHNRQIRLWTWPFSNPPRRSGESVSCINPSTYIKEGECQKWSLFPCKGLFT